jgi:subtilase family serine protease
VEKRLSGRLRHFLGLALAVTGAACLAASASASPMRPALSSVPFVQISDAAAHAAQVTRICPVPTGPVFCYTPSLIQQAYDFPNGRNATGAGQTIVLVEAYGSPTLAADLAAFDAEYKIPDPPSLTVLNQQVPVPGAGGSGNTFFWAVETSLDVEYAHAMAPGANIVVAVANTDDSQNLLQVEQEVLPNYRSAIVSQSFGADETGPCSDPASFAAMETLYADQVQHGGTVVASSGDYGATNLGPLDEHCPSLAPMAGFPASSPLVLAVGGTQGNAYPGGLWIAPGKYGGEQVWNELTPSIFPGAGATGGAPSVVFAAPPWQQGLTTYSTRTQPDVAYNAAVNGGVIIILGGRHGVIGGTSAGAPQWAAIVALANELRGKQGRLPLGRATPQLYAIAQDSRSYGEDFHDILTGNNALGGTAGLPWLGIPPLPGFSAATGFDIPTGLGTPDVANLLKDLSVHESPRLRVDDLAHSANGNRGGHVLLDPRG